MKKFTPLLFAIAVLAIMSTANPALADSTTTTTMTTMLSTLTSLITTLYTTSSTVFASWTTTDPDTTTITGMTLTSTSPVATVAIPTSSVSAQMIEQRNVSQLVSVINNGTTTTTSVSSTTTTLWNSYTTSTSFTNTSSTTTTETAVSYSTVTTTTSNTLNDYLPIATLAITLVGLMVLAAIILTRKPQTRIIERQATAGGSRGAFAPIQQTSRPQIPYEAPEATTPSHIASSSELIPAERKKKSDGVDGDITEALNRIVKLQTDLNKRRTEEDLRLADAKASVRQKLEGKFDKLHNEIRSVEDAMSKLQGGEPSINEKERLMTELAQLEKKAEKMGISLE